MNFHIDTIRTVQFHDKLSAALPAKRAEFESSLRSANESMHAQHMAMGKNKPLEVALSALLLSEQDERRLGGLAEALHEIIEITLDAILISPELMARLFPEHRRIFPYLAKTRGVDTWQVVSRYDAAVAPDGQLKILELNTACPGALLISEAVCLITRHGFEAIHPDWIDLAAMRFGTVNPRRVRDALLDIEKASGIEPGAVGILNDENDLVFELDHLADRIRSRNRNAVIAGAGQLQLRDGRLHCNGQYLSMVHNKFRISTPGSPNHCWRDGFQSRYAAFLSAQQEGHVVSVNNLVGLTVAESKALLASLHDPEIRRRFSPDQQQLVDDHILWTRRLAEGPADYLGQTIDLLPFVRGHREQFVIKPANEGRGFGVAVGKFCTPQQWDAACRPTAEMPKVVQQFTDTVTFPVICDRGGSAVIEPMFLTLGLTTIRGRYEGLISRISANPVTNVAREGFGQAVFVQTP